MRLMLTRPEEDAEPLAETLRALDIEVFLEPLLSIEVLDVAAPETSDVQALLVTSANGVRAFAQLSPNRKMPVYAVGDASARAAREAGFARVESASGDVAALADCVTERVKPEDGVLLHIAGTKVAGDLAGLLDQAGFRYRRARLYEAVKAKALSSEGQALIRNGELTGVVLYSPRTAESLVELLDRANLTYACRKLTAFCLSEAVAKKVTGVDWAMVVVAESPDQSSLMSKIKDFI